MPPYTARQIIGISSLALAGFGGAYLWQQRQQHRNYFQSQSSPAAPKSSIPKTAGNMASITTPFKTLFAVPMHCESCVNDVSGALYKLPGINKVEANLKDQLLTIEGTAAPSAIVNAIQSTGRDAILRGSGDSQGAAVSILETYHKPTLDKITPAPGASDRMVRGLARMVQVNNSTTLVDLTLRGIAPGTYRATIREFGDLARGVESAGPVWSGTATLTADTKAQISGDPNAPRGVMGTVEINKDGRGSVFLSHPFQIWEVIGHAFAVAPVSVDESAGSTLENDENTVVGVIARSAGVWDNDKTVCSCTGKTLWEERKDEVEKGML
ncbi:superoxide dismutase [Neurospora hispaniola]|uniref:Superoxide dismutase 1 copper chaperone n=2 Tax=Neurospora TaxID=5140 RepID=A0AAJ0MS38_9PEZI|nr:superoxide dismutase [Neurospora hispaniola]